MSSEAPELLAYAYDRTPSFRYELLTVGEAPLGDIDGVTGGTIELAADSPIKAGGKLELDDVDGIDWLQARIRPWAIVNDQTWPLGLFIPTAPAFKWGAGRRSYTMELLGKNTTLDQDRVKESVSYPAGTVVTTAVAEQIAAAGQVGAAITASTKTLPAGLMWPADTPRLTIINDLLGVINYWSLWTDGYGRFRADPYVEPAARPIRYNLLDGEQSIYRDEFERAQDSFGIPNRVNVSGIGTLDTAAPIATWENTDPNSPWSQPRRGYWITDTVTGVEAADYPTLQAIARRRGIEKSSATATIPVQHALVPIDMNDVWRFRRVPAGIDARHTVQSSTISLNAMELATTTLREVQDL